MCALKANDFPFMVELRRNSPDNALRYNANNLNFAIPSVWTNCLSLHILVIARLLRLYQVCLAGMRSKAIPPSLRRTTNLNLLFHCYS